jgi:hypothetical protein
LREVKNAGSSRDEGEAAAVASLSYFPDMSSVRPLLFHELSIVVPFVCGVTLEQIGIP